MVPTFFALSLALANLSFSMLKDLPLEADDANAPRLGDKIHVHADGVVLLYVTV